MQFNDRLLLSLLNLHPSDVDSISSSTDEDQNISFHVKLAKRDLSCPICNSSNCSANGFYHRYVTVPYRNFQNFNVHLMVRRYRCRNHHSFSDSLALSPSRSKVSFATIQSVMDLLKDSKMTFKSTAKLLAISETTTIRIFDKYCHISRPTFPEVICIDEVYTKNSDFDSRYSCIFYDFYRRSIIDVLPSRKKNYLHHYFQSFTAGELLSVHYICIDMYLPYKQIAKIYFKKAIICVDSFHVIKHLHDSFSNLRIRLMKSYPTDSIEYYLLKQWKNLLFNGNINLDNKGKYNKKLKRFVNFRQILEMMLEINPQFKTAYLLKERYLEFNSSSSYEKAKEEIEFIIHDFTAAGIPEYSEFITSLVNWKVEIVNSFIVYKGKRINSSVAESMNATISNLIYNSKGIRNTERRRKRIMYAVNKTGFSI